MEMRYLIVAIIASMLSAAILLAFGIDLFHTFGFAKTVLIVAVEAAFGAALLKAWQLDQNKKKIKQSQETKPQ